MMNNVQLQGRVAFVNYRAAEVDATGKETKAAFLSFAISYNTGRKKNPEDQYNREILVRCKSFGKKAEFIYNNFPERSQILIDGFLELGEDYTNKNGELVKGGLEVIIKECHFCGTRETNSTPTPQPQVRPTIAPTAPTAPPVKPVMPNITPIMPKMPGK